MLVVNESPFKEDSFLVKQLDTGGPTEPHHSWEPKHWIQIPLQPLLGLGVWNRDQEDH